MTTFIADDFTALGAALREIEAAKSPAKAADVPAVSVDEAHEQKPTWAGFYGISTAVGVGYDPNDFMGFNQQYQSVQDVLKAINSAAR